MINSEKVITQYLPQLTQSPKLKSGATQLLSKLFHQQEINDFIEENQYLNHFDFLAKANKKLGLAYQVSENSLENIPIKGRVVIIANHPLGSLDGLALLSMLCKIRPDIKVVVNEILVAISPLEPFFLGVNNMSNRSKNPNSAENHRQKVTRIHQALEQDKAVIIFPAGEVSRLTLTGVKDGKWHSGFLKIAKQTKSPILPIFVGGKNSKFFYGLSLIAKPLSTLFLVREMFKNISLTLPMKIGKPIPYSTFSGISPASKESIGRFKKHVYHLKNEREELFETEEPIAHPESRNILQDELNNCPLLGETSDGKSIFLLKNAQNSALLKEIGRLRELSFRAVGEGTGNRRDIDNFDHYYQHIILWDEQDLEIVGSYRIADIFSLKDEHQLYSETLFSYQDSLRRLFPHAMELGRSFVQPQYWGKRSLDYLWQGIGAYLRENPHIRYLFGPVSLSNTFPPFAKDLMVYYFQKYFGATLPLARSFNAYRIKPVQKSKLEKLFHQLEQKSAFTLLRQELKALDCTIPTLFKQYSELCESDGVQFHDFGVDPDFSDCLDSIVWVDILKLKDKKYKRYIG